PRWPHRPAGGIRAPQTPLALGPLDLLQQDRAVHRRAAVGSRGVLVPAGVGRVPALARRAARHAACGRLRRRAPRFFVWRRRPASGGDPPMSTVATDLVARAMRVDGNPDLLQWFTPDDGVFFEHPSRALVTLGAAHTI